MNQRTFGKATRTIGLIIIALFIVQSVAFADNVQNDVSVGGNDTMTAGGSTTVNYSITANSGDGQSGCNAADGSSAIVTINAPAGVTATPNSLTFSNCVESKAVEFTSTVVGNHEITVSVSDSGSTSTVGTYNTNPAKFTLKVNAAAVSDTTAPIITPSIVGTLGDNGWYTSDVTLSWSVVDAESAISSSNGCGTVNIAADQAATTYTCSATSTGGTASQSVTIKRDATAPTLNPSVSPNPVLLNGVATASAGASDNLSGIASQSCDPVDTGSVGGKSVNCTAKDNAGNMNSQSANYSVVYGFVGFEKPVDNGLLNVAKAGQAIPLKFRLVDANGVGVTSLTAVKVTVASLSCSLGMTADAVEEYASGSSGLQNLGDGYYQFNWKTPTTYANSCKTISLDLSAGASASGMVHQAAFQFKK